MAHEEIELVGAKGGTRLRLRVRPSAKRSAVEGAHGAALKVSVAAPPEKGRANEELERLLAGVLGLPRGSVRVATGKASRDKTVLIALEPEEVRVRLAVVISSLEKPPDGATS